MNHCFSHGSHAIPITIINEDDLSYLEELPEDHKRWCQRNNFKGKAGTFCLLPDSQGEISAVLASGDINDMWSLAFLANQLPPHVYEFVGIEPKLLNLHYLAWGLACYRFERYKKNEAPHPALRITEAINEIELNAQLAATYLIRNLINTPCSDMGPTALAQAAQDLAQEYSADCEVIRGKQLAEQFPCVETVGRASSDEPCVVDMVWGEETGPKVTLVGKGICFDSGGLNIKPTPAMRLMKKDMAGAAHALGMAKLIMALDLDIHLRVIIPIAENAISGNAFRPGDVITSRSGKTIEVGNTDAEGRLVLADALDYALAEQPKLLIDFASLTGAARVAVGTEIAAMFCNNEQEAQALTHIAQTVQDPIWPLPLYQPYRKMLDSSIADISNDPASGLGGAITAALFLQQFIDDRTWIHFDMMAWNLSSKPGRPEGGEAMAIRGLLAYLRAHY